MSLTIAQEATLKTLAVMASADSNIQQVEVETVRQIMKDELGVELTSADVRVAAHDEFIEDRSIDKYVKAVVNKLTIEDKKLIARTLKSVILSDGAAHCFEVEMFNKVVTALKMTPAELVQL